MTARSLRSFGLAGTLLLGVTAGAQVRITEFMANNTRTLADADGDYSDWIEIHNPGTNIVNLGNWFLTDDPAERTKWRFPSTNLVANGYLVVFASNKDRRIAGRELHTNFRLSRGGEYLALVLPDGLSNASEYGPPFPPQVADVSYGIPMQAKTAALIATGASAKLLVPRDDTLGESWTDSGFDDSAWTSAITGVGYASDTGETAATVLIADSVADFSGVQGQNNWFYGYYNKTRDLNGQYAAAEFVPFARDEGPFGSANFWTGKDWDWFNGNPPWDEIGPAFMHPNGVNNGEEHWTIRRWINTFNGTLSIDWHLAKQDPNGSGVTGRIFQNGIRRDAITLAGNDLAGVSQTVVITNAQSGDFIDFALAPTGVANATDDISDGSNLSATIYAFASLSSQIASNIQTVMSNINATVYVRIPLAVADPSAVDFLTLRMKYEDGFIAYLNGGEVARRNAPDSPAWNSSATAARLDSDAVEFEDFDLSGALGLLHVGENVLAIQGLNSQAADPGFLILPELQATSLTFETTAERYFAVPTPGAINGFGNTNLGPLILEVSHAPAIPSDDQDLVVTARLVRTFDAIGNVALNYRVMFGPEMVVPMMDDGSHGDGAAGDGVYGGIIPASASVPGQMVRYYVTAADANGDRSRWPLFPDARTSPQYLGTVVADLSVTSALPVLHWFIQTPAGADNGSGTRCSVFFEGEFYDNFHVYVHGQSSLGFPKKSYNFDLNKGYHFRYATNEARVSDFNLLTTYPDKAHLRNMLAYGTYRDAGAPYHIAFALRVQQNGKFYSDAHYVENGNDTYLKRIGLDPNGSLYKMYNVLDSATTGVEKKTRKNESNSDLQALINGLRRTGAARTQFIYDNVNIPEMVNYLAAMIITGGVDCCHKNYYAYRDTEGTGEWQFLPWDLDLTFGRNWTGSLTYFDDTMYTSNPLFIGGNNALPNALFGTPVIRQMYLRRVRTLMDELLQPPATPSTELKYEKAINELAAAIAPDAALDFGKWPTWGQRQTMPQALNILTNKYFPARRNYLFNTQVVAKGGQIPNSQPADAVINFGAIEFNPASGNQLQEYIELVNTNNYAVDISGWRLAGGIAHTFAGGVVLPAGSKLYVSPNVAEFRTRSSGPRAGQGLLVTGNYHGQLSARGETINLFDLAGRAVSSSTYIGNPSPAQQYLRITEIMYHPAPPSPGSSFTAEDFEYIVLKNIGPLPLDLTGVHFSNGVEFSFTNAAINNLAPAQSVVIAKNAAAYASRYGEGNSLAGSYQGNLDNSGENLRLEDAMGEKVLDFSYDNSWYPETDGAGSALVVVDETAPWFAWELKTNWRPGLPNLITDIAAWKAKYFNAAEMADPAIAGDNADPDGDGQANFQEFVSGTDPRDAQSYLRVGSVELIGENRATFRLGFNAVGGKTYTLLYRDSLSEGVWLKLADFTAQPISRLIEFSDPVVRNAKNRYYRLVTPKQE